MRNAYRPQKRKSFLANIDWNFAGGVAFNAGMILFGIGMAALLVFILVMLVNLPLK